MMKLTHRQKQILPMVCRGKLTKEIADELKIALGTAQWHIERLRDKLGVVSRVQILPAAVKLGLIKVEDL
jgi:DNA-binding CsgD family transcriptional regulator